MNAADSDNTTESVLGEHLAAIDDLLSRPFPTESYRDAATDAGPSHHVLVLRQSQDFWEDSDGEASRQAYADMESHLEALISALTDRWGEPEAVDLWQYLTASFDGAAAPEPIDMLCQTAVTMQVWRQPEADHWVGLAIGQADKELPLELIAAVGIGAALRPPTLGE
ncbi:hypothetical protein LO771_24240 [Streptacidiphilus sp. ASG 303]|uniref:hypothetical protein n=1 Tax=Streptacidiphilus sp. ASG 303 TaxID=2896847 RepID=UPI001E3F90A8|nr:hypothetical protein [Streptacidiphilus sp. ASG 303]MCD0485409.1 hypothetical protein [Streptacidiphilus sp. ASG 303]